MEFPFGHHREHHRRHQRDEEQENPNPFEHHTPNYNIEEQNPVHHEHHRPSYSNEQYPDLQHRPGYSNEQYPDLHENRFQRPPDFNSGSYPPPNPDFPEQSPNYPPPPPSYLEPQPVYSQVHHVSHETGPEFESDPSEFHPVEHGDPERHKTHHGFSIFHHSHGRSNLPKGPDVRVFCQAETGYSLTIRDGKVILAPENANDQYQHWIKDEKFSIRVKDEEGFPSFALVNKATGQALKHSIGATHPVQLTDYRPDELDESILWTESRDAGEGYRAIRMVNNIKLNLDAFNGDKKHGGVHDGTIAVLWEWKKGDNQRWKIMPH